MRSCAEIARHFGKEDKSIYYSLSSILRSLSAKLILDAGDCCKQAGRQCILGARAIMVRVLWKAFARISLLATPSSEGTFDVDDCNVKLFTKEQCLNEEFFDVCACACVRVWLFLSLCLYLSLSLSLFLSLSVSLSLSLSLWYEHYTHEALVKLKSCVQGRNNLRLARASPISQQCFKTVQVFGFRNIPFNSWRLAPW